MTDLEKTGGTMNCGVVSELLASFHAGKLNARAEQSVREHLDGCAACSVRLASLERQTRAAREGMLGGAIGGLAGADESASNDGGVSDHWWQGVPKLALFAIGLALVVVPGSFWFANARTRPNHAPIVDADLPAIAALRRMGDDEARTVGFNLRRPTDLRVYALGEGSDGEMHDYGWIVDAATRRTVWTMEYSETNSAGGADKNRMVDDIISLDPGSYVLQYKTDGSHSFEDWNSDPPDDQEAWGITVTVADANDRRSVGSRRPTGAHGELADAVEAATAAAMEAARVAAAEAVRGARAEIDREMQRTWSEVEVVAQLTRVGDDADLRQPFTLDRDSQVRIYALGEGTFGEMHDYAWIEDANTNHPVWRMDYDQTEHAGGADKNRMVDAVVRLGAGEYVLRFQSDDSHAFESWNLAAPPDAANYGVTLFREGR